MPRVSIGLPLYNGQDYLAQAVDSLLAQTYEDFELILSDNASSDASGDICRSYQARDPRVRYYRAATNQGAAWNYNRVVELARGEYFKWAAHDDWCAPEFVSSCVEVLDRAADVVLCFTEDVDVDESGRPVDRRRQSHISMADRAGSPRPHDRYQKILRLDHDCEQIFGLIRLPALRETGLIRGYADADRTLLAELALRGRFFQVPRPLFYHRHHQSSSTKAYPLTSGWEDRAAWFETAVERRVLYPECRQFADYAIAPCRAQLPFAERLRCWFRLGVNYRYRFRRLANEAFRGLAREFHRGRHAKNRGDRP